MERKRGAGIVTIADKEAERFIVSQIRKKFPQSAFLAEESGRSGRGNLLWIIDPLDGTSNFAHGFPWFCVSIALYVDGVPTAGIIQEPVFNETFFASRGGGAYLNGKKIQVSKISKLKDALLGTGFYYQKGPELKRQMELFRCLNEKALAVRRPGSAALDLAYVACGRYDGFWEKGLAPWDVAAGFLIVEEAGGKFSNYKGNPTTIYDREVLATNGKIHRSMVSVTRLKVSVTFSQTKGIPVSDSR